MRYNMPRFDIQDIVGTSAEAKPTNIRPGSTFTETDTGKKYLLTSDGWTRVGGAWRLWSGDPEAEPLADATTKKWLVDCEIYAAVTNVGDDPSLSLEGRYFARKGDAADGTIFAGAVATIILHGNIKGPALVGVFSFSSLTPVDGGIGARGEWVYADAPTGTTWEDAMGSFELPLAFNDEEQPDRIMVWIYDETAQPE